MQWPLWPSEGLAEVVVSHLLVAVSFPPPRLERAVAPRTQGADPSTAQSFRNPPSVHGTQLGIAVFVGLFWDFGSLPAVTSASEVLT